MNSIYNKEDNTYIISERGALNSLAGFDEWGLPHEDKPVGGPRSGPEPEKKNIWEW